jgi:ABC-type branched-subunit amino acid transport system ATPase component/predicted MFS family arabinose efflux permease
VTVSDTDVQTSAPAGEPAGPRPTLSDRVRQFVVDAGPVGVVPLVVIVLLAAVQQFDLVAFGVLSPDIRRAFHVSNGTITVVASLTLAVPIFLAFLIGYLGDRVNRIRLSVALALLWGVTAVFTGLAPALAILVIARLIGGVGLIGAETVYPGLLADYYPPRSLGTVFGVFRVGGQGLALLGGSLAGVIAAVMGWRATFVVLAVPTFVFAIVARALLQEPSRGSSQGVSGTAERVGTIREGFRRVRAIPTLKRTWFGAFLFGGGTIPFATLLNTFFKDVYHLGDASRGLITTLFGVGGLVGIALGGVLTQRAVRTGQPRRLALITGLMIVEFALGIVVMAGVPVFAVAVAAAAVLSVGAFGFLPSYTSMVSLVAPPRLRSQAFAWSLFFYSSGAIVVSLIIGGISNAHGQRVSLVVLASLVLIGGLVNASAARFVPLDVDRAVRVEVARRSEALLHCQGVDAAYGGVQVLFGVDFEVQRGEMVAVLGTNGAGKSTFLKAITGLLDPVAGIIQFKGDDITHADPTACARLGIMQVPGGRSIFPTLSVAENMKVAGWLFRKDRGYLETATRHVLSHFPILEERWTTMAGDLSGGEQQMLSLAQAFIAEPELLLVDELSLGLAPTVVSRLVEILRQIHERGTTIIIVEQSVNTALELAERAIFMEKGEVRFSGPTAELLERPDILRAVFLQGAAAGEELASSNPGHGDGSRPTDSVARPARRARARPQAQPVEPQPVVLETKFLSKRFGGVTAVNEVSFELRQGEILGFIGPNGAGKTSLFDLISGFSIADSGHVVFNGLDVTGWAAHERAHLGLGRSFQDARLWPELTVAECLAVALHLEGETEAALPALLGVPRVASSERMIHERVDELVDLMALGAFRNKFVGELSTGSRRIVELACILAHRPQVLLLDEPSSGIAQRETEALAPLIRRIRAQLGASILIIEHDIPLISELADHLVGLDLGQVVAYGRPPDVLSDPHVVESYLGTAAEKLRLGNGSPPSPRWSRPADGDSRTRSSSSTPNGDAADDTLATDVREAMAAFRARRVPNTKRHEGAARGGNGSPATDRRQPSSSEDGRS